MEWQVKLVKYICRVLIRMSTCQWGGHQLFLWCLMKLLTQDRKPDTRPMDKFPHNWKKPTNVSGGDAQLATSSMVVCSRSVGMLSLQFCLCCFVQRKQYVITIVNNVSIVSVKRSRHVVICSDGQDHNDYNDYNVERQYKQKARQAFYNRDSAVDINNTASLRQRELVALHFREIRR